MITLTFETDDERVTRVKLDAHDLTGYERDATLKDALERMDVQNPCVTFSRKMKTGEYPENYPENELADIATVSSYLADLWQYDPVPNAKGEDMRPYMNPLMLLERAFNMLLKEREKIIDYMEKES